jgi:RNA polymerase sigma factor (sigma-70 family)
MQAAAALHRPDEREIELRPWLYAIARNASIDLLRRTPPAWEELDPQHDGVPQPPQIAERRESLARMISQIRSLPDRQRTALLLREFEGRDYDEIGLLMGEGGGAVRQLLFRARERMRAAAAAVVVFPFGLGRGWTGGVRRVGHLIGAKGGASAGTSAIAGVAKAGAGVAVVLAVAGGAAVLDHHAARLPVAQAAVSAPPVARTQPASATASASGSGSYSVRAPSFHPGHRRAHSQVAARRAAAPAPKSPRAATAPVVHQTSPASPAPQQQAPQAVTPAPHHEPAQTPQPPASAPKSSPAPPATEPPHTQPAPGGGPPPATFSVTSYEQSTGFGGVLTLQRLSNGEQVVAWFGENTDLRCWYTGGPAPTNLETCTKDHLVAGTQVADAAHAVNQTSGREVWTRVYLIVPR